MDSNKKIEELKKELNDKYGIKTDRDLINQLGIKSEEDKSKLFAWIHYQCAFEYRNGLKDGAEILRETVLEAIKEKE